MFKHRSSVWPLPLLLAVAFALVLWTPGVARAADDEEMDENPGEGVPAAVMKTARHYAPDLKVEDVTTREVKGHPKMYVIEGDSQGKDVVLTIEEGGDIREARFQAAKHAKATHAPEELPDAVRKTATRAIPKLKILSVKSTQAPNEDRVYHLTGQVNEDGQDRSVVLAIESDGDLVEARVFKPKKEMAKAAAEGKAGKADRVEDDDMKSDDDKDKDKD